MMDGWSDEQLRAVVKWREDRDRRERAYDPGPRSAPYQVWPSDDREPCGMDDVPLIPLSAYHDMGAGPAEAAAPGKPFRFIPVGDLELREPEYHVAGMIETETVGVLFGDPASGKSFVAVDLACCIASGVDFHGRKVRQGSAFYVAGEGHNGLARRFHAWARHHGRDIADMPVFKSNRAAQILDVASAAEVGRAVRDMSDMHGSPALIIIDTLARNFGDGDENCTQDMNGFVAAIDDLRSDWPRTTVIVVHHTGHAEKGRGRGSMALKGAVDFEFGVAKTGETITLTNAKMKDAPELPEQFFTLHDVQLAPNIQSAVLTRAEAPEMTARPTKITGQARIALQAFGDALAHHGVQRVGDMFPADRQCVSLEHWREFCDRHSLSSGESSSASRKAFHDAKRKLQEAGAICIVDGFAWRVEG